MAKEKKMPKEYAIVTSLMIFFTLVILIGSIRIYLVTKDRIDSIDLSTINVIESDTNIDMSSYNLRIANSIREKYNTDVFKFRDLYYKTDHKYFNKNQSNWYEEVFPNLSLEVTSKIELYEKGNTLGGTKYERENK